MTAARHTAGWLLALAAAGGGCGSSLGAPCADGSCGSQTWTKTFVTYAADRRLDLLFVVDDTSAIAPYADRVAAGLASMAAALQNSAVPLSVHVGFARAGSCDTNPLVGGCGISPPTPFVELQPCNVVTNASGAFVDTVACLGALGAGDCGPNQPMAAALRALDPTNAAWGGFLRSDAYLDVVIIAATDDASGPPSAPTTSPLDIAQRLKALKPDPSQVMVTVIGPGDCATRDGQAQRLLQLVNEFGSNGLYMRLCDDPLSAAIDRIVSSSNVGLPPLCLTNVLDADAATPGLQASCTVTRRSTEIATGRTSEQKIPSCDDAPPPCWHQPTPGVCGGGSPGWWFSLEDSLNQCDDGSISLEIECLACADPNDPACGQPQAQAQ
jgi:hypothetical protein